MKTVERKTLGSPLRHVIRIDTEPLSDAEARNRTVLIKTAEWHSNMLTMLAQYQELLRQGKATQNDVASIQEILRHSYSEEEIAIHAPVLQHRSLIILGRHIPLPSKRAA